MKAFVFQIITLFTLSIQAQDITKVLFIGNSLTYYNSMPETFESIANSLGNSTEVTVYAPGGTGFVNHVTDQNVYNYFKQGDWDYIVLQPGSNESPGYSFPIEETLDRAKMLNDSIVEYNPCAKVLYYEISYGVWGNSPANLATYNTTMDLIKDNISILADSTETFFAPVGEAFRTSWNADLTNMLWGSPGDIHPNAKGSYLAACVFYSSIFQDSSSNSTITNGLPISEALGYRELADSIVLNHLPNWRINTYDTYLDYSYMVDNDTVYFTNLSLNIDSVVWDFGDGSTSNVFSPNKVYTTNGSFDVLLTVYSDGCIDSLMQTIDINGLTINDVTSNTKYEIYPNPVQDILYMNNNSSEPKLLSYTVYDVKGQLQIKSQSTPIHVSHLSEGVYFIEIIDIENKSKTILKWVKL